MNIDFGPLGGGLIGLGMKEALRRADKAVETMRFGAAAHAKGVKAGGGTDFFTDADLAAQRAIVRVLRKNFPTFGLVGEEEGLYVEGEREAHGGWDLWFTIDPIDGTSAFMREQSHGVGSMIALVCDGQVIGAYVRDLCTHEVYGFRPGSPHADRIMPTDEVHRLGIDEARPLSGQYLLLRDPPDVHGSPIVETMSRRGSLFRQFTMAEGSIGISMARLWKGEVGAAVMRPSKNTPWDWAPVFGISRYLGFRFYSIIEDGPDGFSGFRPFDRPILKVEEPVEHPLLAIHHSRLDELDAWIAQTYGSGVTLVRRE